MINESGKWFYCTPTGQAFEGENPPDGSTVLVAPGGQIDDNLAKRYGVDKKLGGEAAKARRTSSGEPIVTKGGRAFAAGVIADDDEEKVAAMEAAGEEDEAKDRDVKKKEKDEPGVKVEADAASKSVRLGGDVEDKAVRQPVADAPKPPRRK